MIVKPCGRCFQGWRWFGDPLRRHFERDPSARRAWKSHRGESEGRRVAASAACHLVLTWRHCMFCFPGPRCMEGRFSQVYWVSSTLRCVDVIWFIFHVVQLPPIRFTLLISCYVSKFYDGPHAKIGLKIGHSLIVLWSSEVHVLVEFLAGYRGPPNCVHCWVWSSYKYLKA